MDHGNYRRLAEQLIRKARGTQTELAGPPDELLHELQVHQIELQMQNDELRAAQAELEESRHKYVDLYDFAPVGYFTFDPHGLIVEANLTGADLLGTPRSELLHRPFANYIAVEDQEIFREHRRRLGTSKTRGSCELRLRRGGLIVQLDSVYVSGPDNWHCRTTVSDISLLKRTEQALRASEATFAGMVETVPALIVLLDTDGRVLLFNRACEDLSAYRREEVLGKNLLDVLVPRDRRRATMECLRSIVAHAPGARTPHESPWRTKSGEERMIEWRCTMLPGRPGEDARILSTGIDVTERQRTQAELLKTSKLESVGLLAGGIAHDFNNILTAILGNLYLAKLSLDSGNAVYQSLGDAENACLRAKGLTQQLLTFSRGGAPVKKVFSLPPLLNETLALAMTGSSIVSALSLPPDLWPVAADEGQISQVLHNLLLNAQQAMPGGGRIEVRAENVALEGGGNTDLGKGRYVRLSVMDQGVGIEPDDLTRIFDPFYTTKPKGSGLGLTTSYWIVKKHGGQITVQSKPGDGTTFAVYLPAANAGEIELAAAAPEQTHSGGGRVLVMDDDPSILNLVKKILVQAGYDTECVHDGERAIERYRQARDHGRPFDVVILDLTVPGGMGGKETLAKLREVDPRVKAIVSSGYSTDTVMAEFERYGFAARVEKPFRVTELQQKLQQVMDAGDRAQPSARA